MIEHVFTAEVITSEEGFTSIHIIDLTGGYPTLHVVERSAEGQVAWLGSDACTFPLHREQVLEVLPFLLNFLESGRLILRR